MIPTMLDKTFEDFLHVLAELLFTTSETEQDYYHQKVNVRVPETQPSLLKFTVSVNFNISKDPVAFTTHI